jgi:hypothetical protein
MARATVLRLGKVCPCQTNPLGTTVTVWRTPRCSRIRTVPGPGAGLELFGFSMYLPKVLSYNRRAVRQRFEERYTATRMAKDYVNTYRKLSMKRTTNREPPTTWPRPINPKDGNGLNAHVD